MNKSEDQYLAESILTNSEGEEIARGNGAYHGRDVSQDRSRGTAETQRSRRTP